MKKLLFFFFLALLSAKSHATVNENEGWLGLVAKKPIYENAYSLFQEVQLKYDFDRGEMGQVEVRFGLLRPFNENHELGMLLAYIQSNSAKEYAPTIQHVYSKTFGSYFFSFRSRLEWRDLENNSTNSLRLRLVPTFRWSFQEKLALAVWDETFYNLTDETWTGNRFFEKNRFFVGLRHDRPGFIFEYGYLNQLTPRHNRDTVDHVLVVNLYY